MATYSRAELHITRIEFLVPAPAPWGAAWGEVFKAVRAAETELIAAGEIPEGQGPSDDQICIAPGDDSVVISYELRVRTRGSS